MRSFLENYFSDGNFRKLLKNGGYLFTSSSFVSVLLFAETVILTRALLPGGYGTLVLVISCVLMINQLLDIRVRDATVSFGSTFLKSAQFEKSAATIKLSYLIDLLTGCLSFFLVASTAGWIATRFFEQPMLTELIQLYAFTLLIATLRGTNHSVLQILNKFKWIAVYEACLAVVQVVFVSTSVLLGFGVKGVLVALLTQEVLRTICSTILSIKAIQIDFPVGCFFKSRLSQLAGRRRDVFSMMMHTNLIAYFRMINTKVDILILGYFHAAEVVGGYKLARSLATVMGKLSDPFFSAILPDLSGLWGKQSYQEFRALISKASAGIVLILIPIVCLSLVFDEEILVLVSGEEFQGNGLIFSICVFTSAIGSAFFWTWPASVGINRPVYGTLTGLIGVVLQVALSLWLVPVFAGVGNAVALLVTYATTQPIIAWLVFQHIKKSEKLTNTLNF